MTWLLPLFCVHLFRVDFIKVIIRRNFVLVRETSIASFMISTLGSEGHFISFIRRWTFSVRVGYSDFIDGDFVLVVGSESSMSFLTLVHERTFSTGFGSSFISGYCTLSSFRPRLVSIICNSKPCLEQGLLCRVIVCKRVKRHENLVPNIRFQRS